MVASNAVKHGGRSAHAIAQMRQVRAMLSECASRLTDLAA